MNWTARLLLKAPAAASAHDQYHKRMCLISSDKHIDQEHVHVIDLLLEINHPFNIPLCHQYTGSSIHPNLFFVSCHNIYRAWNISHHYVPLSKSFIRLFRPFIWQAQTQRYASQFTFEQTNTHMHSHTERHIQTLLLNVSESWRWLWLKNLSGSVRFGATA